MHAYFRYMHYKLHNWPEETDLSITLLICLQKRKTLMASASVGIYIAISLAGTICEIGLTSVSHEIVPWRAELVPGNPTYRPCVLEGRTQMR